MVQKCRSEFRVNSATSNEINEHFANIAKDPLYVKELVTSQVNDCFLETEDFTESSEEYIIALLSKISRTSLGCDNIPFWFFKYFAFHSDSKRNGIVFACSSDLKPQKMLRWKCYCVGRHN